MARITKTIRPMVQRTYYKYDNSDALLVAPYKTFNIMKISSWQRTFGTTAELDDGRSFGIDRVSLENIVTINTEPSDVTFTYFIVKLKKAASQLFNPLTGELAALVSDVHYFQPFSSIAIGRAGGVYLNKEYFYVIKCKKFRTGQFTALGAEGDAKTYHRWTDKIKLGITITNPAGAAINMACPQDMFQNYFVIMFNDNLAVDNEYPMWKFNMLVSGHSTA